MAHYLDTSLVTTPLQAYVDYVDRTVHQRRHHPPCHVRFKHPIWFRCYASMPLLPDNLQPFLEDVR